MGLDFGFCTVNEESSRTFELVNVGQVRPTRAARTGGPAAASCELCGPLDSCTDIMLAGLQVAAPFRWETPTTFCLEPMCGEIPVGKSQTVRVFLTPAEASVFVCR